MMASQADAKYAGVAIAVEHIVKRYGKFEAVSDVSFDRPFHLVRRAPHQDAVAVQQAIAQSMLNEGDVGVREQAVELLTGQPTRDQQVVGALQELMIREQNRQLREQVRQILEAVNASTDMY